MKYKGAIFDMDGILFDTEKMYQDTWHELAEKYNVKLGEHFVYEISGTNGSHMDRVLEKNYHVKEGAAIRIECMESMKRKLAAYVPVKTGVREILQYFHENGYKTAVASSSAREQIQDNLRMTELDRYFDVIVSGSEVTHGKPAPDIFLHAAKKMGCEPDECFVFEDSENGVRAGYAAGCAIIMIPDLIEPAPEIKHCCAGIYKDLLQAMEEID